MTINKKNKIYVAGHNGMVGSSIVRMLKRKGFNYIITKTRKELDLTNQQKVNFFFKKNKIDFVFLCAAKVGGIYANDTYRADFISENLMIQTNIIDAAYKNGVKNLIFLGSSCVYPNKINRKISEKDLLSSYLEPTNEPYAIAKIAGIKMCESYNEQYNVNYKNIMPTNLFGPGDNFHPQNSHVVPALIRKFIIAVKSKKKQVIIWGTGTSRREFLYVDDLAEAIYLIAKLTKKKYRQITNNKSYLINVGYGKDYKISTLVKLISKALKFKGKIVYDVTKKDGVKRKILNSQSIRSLGWKPKFNFEKKLPLFVKELYKKRSF